MKNISKITLAVIAMFTIMAFTSYNSTRYMAPLEIAMKPAELLPIEPKIELVEIELPANTHKDFLEAIGHRESGNRYNIVNKYGYMGRYQFGKATLKGLGFKITQDEFLNSPYIQEKAMQALLEHNKKKLKKIIDEYCGREFKDIYITESGILAAAHLAGQGNVKKFFKRGREFKDGFGTSMTSYLDNFSGYQLDLN